MSKKSFFLYSLLLTVVVLSQIRSVYAQPPNNLGYKPGELIVRFAPTATGLQRTKGERNNVLRVINAGSLKHSYKLVLGLSVIKLPAVRYAGMTSHIIRLDRVIAGSFL